MNTIRTILLNFCFCYFSFVAVAQTNFHMIDSSIVKLSSFEIKQNGKHIKIKWSTLYEKNNDYFILQRSDDEGTWSDIETIPGSNNSNKEIYYDYVDFSPKDGKNYYRLFCKNKNGEIVDLTNEKINFYENIYFLSISENDELSINGDDLNINTLKMYDFTGNNLLTNSSLLYCSTNKICFNIQKIPMGLYLVHINNEVLTFMKF